MKPIEYQAELDRMIEAIKVLRAQPQLHERLLAHGYSKNNKPLLTMYDWFSRTLYAKLNLDPETDKELRQAIMPSLNELQSTMFFSATAVVQTTVGVNLMVLLYDSIKYLTDQNIGVSFEFDKNIELSPGKHGVPFRIFFETDELVIEGCTV